MQRLISLRKTLHKPSSSSLRGVFSATQNKTLSTFKYSPFSGGVHKPRGENQSPYDIKTGDLLSGFRVIKTEEIPLYSMKAFILEHEKTKARYIHLHTPDSNNCFAVLLRTTPDDDKGAPHILEHTVLCGSEKYPVRDPFFNMLKRSLNTYMNAWTGSDFTCYPFSTQNEKDFKNLLDVYVQAVYKPLINRHDFLQEGWRYDFQKEGDSNSDLIVKGIVYNEMKGVMQTADNLFLDNLQKSMFKDSPYRFTSGGLPSAIPLLSYEELKQFYNKFYHPSNSFFYSYGDLDFREHLKFLEENYLKNYDYVDPKTEIPLQKRYNEPVTAYIKSPPDAVAIDPERQAKFGVSFLCNNIVEDPITSFSMQLLSYMLFETPSSPFYQTLIESGLASGYCPGYGYDSNMKQGTLTIGVRNIGDSKEEIEMVEKIINETLEKVAAEGFSKEFIESALHQTEITAKLPKADSGIFLLQQLISFMNHNGDPLSVLKINETLQEIRNRIEKGGYFEGLVKKYLIENPHRVKLIMTPDAEVVKQEVQREKKLFEQAQKDLNEEKKIKIIQENLNLKKIQEAHQDVNVLPTLEIEDIPKSTEKTEFKIQEIMGIPVYFTNQPTNGIVSLRIKIDLKHSPLYFKPFLRLFTRFFPKLGTKTHEHSEFNQLLELYAYNFEVEHLSFTSPEKVEEYGEYLVLSISCLEKNVHNMFNLLTELVLDPDFKDYEHFKNLLKIHSSDAANSFMEDSLTYAMSYASGGLREAIRKTEKLQSARFLCNIAAEANKSGLSRILMEEIERQMFGVMGYILRREILSFCIHGNQDIHDTTQKEVEKFLDTLNTKKKHIFNEPAKLFEEWEIDDSMPLPGFQPQLYKTFFSLPMQVNYVVQSLPIPHYTHADTPSLHILADLMSSNVLLREIREKGGAYGGGSRTSRDGVFNFYSYRDPNLLETYDAFKRGIDWASANKFSDQDIKETKLKVFSSVDRVESPLEKGLRYFITGISDEMRNNYRQKLLNVGRDDIVRVAREYLEKPISEKKSSQVIFGSQNANLKELENQGWSIETPVEGLEASE